MTAPGVFICYERDDTASPAGRLYDRLSDRIGEDRVFMDVDSIRPGVDFVESLQSALASCEVLLAVIGPGWVDRRNSRGQRALDDETDYVRLEIQTALERGIPVIPVLVNEAKIPREDELPSQLASLSRRQVVHLRHATFRPDSTRLVDQVQQLLEHPVVQPDPTPDVPADTDDSPAAEATWSAVQMQRGPRTRVFRLQCGARTHILRYEHKLLGGRVLVDDADPLEGDCEFEFVLPGSGNDPDVPGTLHIGGDQFIVVGWINELRLDIAGVTVFEWDGLL